MRLPPHVMDRVRGVAVVAVLGACGGQAPAAPPHETVVPVAAETPPPPPVDPVPYARADEDGRLARLDLEDATRNDERTTRIDHLRDAQRPHGAVGISGIGLSPHVCYACGRG